MQTHVYRPIEADTTIRVLNLEPALHRSDPLVGTIHTRPIEDDSTSPLLVYDCLSYCWGRSGKNSEIACDGQRLRITENLETILRRLRRPTSPFLIWIDAICINQDDPVEKTKQVQKMGAIYERAGEVHIWLGPASEQDQIPSVLSVLREKAILKKRIEVDEQDRDTRIAKVLDVLVKPLAAFLSRPWFTRRWGQF